MVSGEWRTKNPQPNFTLYALRFTLLTLNSQRAIRNLFSGLTPLLPANFTLYASRFTSHASRFTPHAPQGYNLGIKVVINKWVRKKIRPKGGVNDEVASVVGHLCHRRPAVEHLINQGVGS
jgi:hypothetical protein